MPPDGLTGGRLPHAAETSSPWKHAESGTRSGVCAQNAANGIALRTRDDMLRLDAMIMSVQLGIRKLLEVFAAPLLCTAAELSPSPYGSPLYVLVLPDKARPHCAPKASANWPKALPAFRG